MTGLLIAATSSWMPKRTALGSELLRRVLGFRLYIDTAERVVSGSTSAPTSSRPIFPYAIVFGCAEKWARVFSEVDTTKIVAGWYTGGAAFGALAMSQHRQGFSSCVAHSINNLPANVSGARGVSGFGGGGFSGFSGGGFGGGGFSGGGGGW